MLDDRSVSRRHALIERDGNQIRLSDLGSTNGTWVNDRRIDDAVILREGDQVRIGGVAFRLELSASSSAPGPASTGEVAKSVTGERRHAATAPPRPSRRKPISPIAVAISTLLLVVAGFAGAIYFLSWDQIEQAAEIRAPLRRASAVVVNPVHPAPAPATTPGATAILSNATSNATTGGGALVGKTLVLSPAPAPHLSAPTTAPAAAIASAKTPFTSADSLANANSAGADAADAGAVAWLAPLNYYRSISGLYSVRADPALSAADVAHSRYVVKNYADRIRSLKRLPKVTLKSSSSQMVRRFPFLHQPQSTGSSLFHFIG